MPDFRSGLEEHHHNLSLMASAEPTRTPVYIIKTKNPLQTIHRHRGAKLRHRHRQSTSSQLHNSATSLHSTLMHALNSSRRHRHHHQAASQAPKVSAPVNPTNHSPNPSNQPLPERLHFERELPCQGNHGTGRDGTARAAITNACIKTDHSIRKTCFCAPVVGSLRRRRRAASNLAKQSDFGEMNFSLIAQQCCCCSSAD